MSNRSKRSTKGKKPLTKLILVNRKDFVSAFRLMSHALQAMGDEFEMFRASKEMDPELRSSMMHVVSAHLNNLSHISTAFQLSIYDPIDPDGTQGRDLN